MKPYVDHEDEVIKSMRFDPEFTAGYLNAVLEDGTDEELKTALRRVAAASSSPADSDKSIPVLRSFLDMIRAAGMHFTISSATAS